MIINDKIVQVYDIEVFPNVFSCTVKNTETGLVKVFEISHRTDNVIDVATNMANLFLDKDYIFCGYNNIHYDNPIMNFIITNLKTMPNDYIRVCTAIYKLSQIIVTSETSESWKQWKYANLFATVDLLTMLFSQKLRVGLKEMQVTMQFHNVQEYEGNFDDWLPDEEIPKMLKYNLNDVDSTEELLNRCKDQIDLRIGIQKEYNVDVLSMDGVSIGKEILKVKYLQDTHKTWWDIKDLRSPCDMVELNKVILPVIEFKTPILQKLLKEMKTLTVSPGIKGWNKQFLFYETVISIGVGGIHSINQPEIIKPKEDEVLIDADAASLYPTLLINWNFAPKHLGNEFLQTYSNIKNERIKAKHNGDKIKNETLKLTLNSVTGLMQSEFSWLYSPEDVMRIRMNGQLFLLMLAEKLILATNCRIIQYNTDGIFILLKKNQLETYKQVIKEFESISRLTFEDEEYESFYQYAINDYLAIGKGYAEARDKFLVGEKVLNSKGKPFNSIKEIQKAFIKQKGLFIDKVNLGKGMQPMIIPEALNRYFADGIPIIETIKDCKDLNKFITYQKADKKFSVEYDNKLISRINRYYVSTNGPFLYKCEIENNKRVRYINMLKASGVTIVNNLDEINEFPKNINYRYYIAECNKIINPFVHTQLSLF